MRQCTLAVLLTRSDLGSYRCFGAQRCFVVCTCMLFDQKEKGMGSHAHGEIRSHLASRDCTAASATCHR